MNQTSCEYLYLVSYLLLCNGKIDRAITLLQALLAVDENHINARHALAYAYLTSGQYQACLDSLDIAESSSAANEFSPLIRVRALWGLGRHDDARNIVERYNGKLRQRT